MCANHCSVDGTSDARVRLFVLARRCELWDAQVCYLVLLCSTSHFRYRGTFSLRTSKGSYADVSPHLFASRTCRGQMKISFICFFALVRFSTVDFNANRSHPARWVADNPLATEPKPGRVLSCRAHVQPIAVADCHDSPVKPLEIVVAASPIVVALAAIMMIKIMKRFLPLMAMATVFTTRRDLVSGRQKTN